MPAISVFCHTLQSVDWLSPSRSSVTASRAVFRVRLAEFEPWLPEWYALLTPDETRRAQRYRQSKDQHRFIIVRAVLRSLLAIYTGQPPASLQFTISATKKPGLVGWPDLYYNVSHSGEWALVALSQTPIGVDVEKINTDFPFQDIIRHNFSRAEQRCVETAPDPVSCFYQCWTRKEALLKATGRGLTDQLPLIPSLDGFHTLDGSLISANTNFVVTSFSICKQYQTSIAHPSFFFNQRTIFLNLNSQFLRN